MKLTFVFLLITLLRVNASTYAQNVSINIKNATLKEVFSQLTKQTGYNFICDVELIKDMKPITIAANKISLKDLLDRCFENQSVNILFNIDNTVVITEKNKYKLPLADNNIIIVVAITGSVTDESGQPLPGVSVTEKGTTNGVITDNSGKYTLKVAGPNSTIVFSYIGFETQEIKVNKQTVIGVQLKAKAGDLDEVVVLGYTTQKRASVTGSASSISGAEISTTKNQSVLNMLTGKIPGVRILQNTSEPGNFNNNFDIRGFGTPLIIIDGVPRGNIDRLDPNDIESISVLKDAAAAVYGVQAGNGVILVTTKKGKAGTSSITFNSYQGIQHESGVQSALNAVDYMNLVNEKTMHNINAPASTIFTPAQIADYGPGGTKQSTDWFNETFRKTALQNQENVSVTGGTDKSTYFMSMGYLNQGSFYKTNAETYHKYNMRSNLTANIAKGLTADLQLAYISDTRNYPTQDAQVLLNSVYRNPPIFAAYAGDPGNHLNNFGDHGPNAVAYSDKNVVGYRNNNKKILQGTFDLIYDIPFVSGLRAKALYSYNNTIDDNKTFNKEWDGYTSFIQGDGTTGYTVTPNNNPSNVTQSYNTAPTTLMQFSLAYNHTFGKYHNINVSAIYEEGTSQNFNFGATDYIAISTLDQIAAGGDVTIGPTVFKQTANFSGFPSSTATRSLLGIVHYDYKGKYLIDVTGRRDGSSSFSPIRQFGFFPGATAAWRISEEGFIKNNNSLSFIDNLKLRGSYGQTGQAGQVNFQFLNAYDYPAPNSNVQTLASGYVFGGTYVKDIGFRAIPNQDATWAAVTTLNAGLDAEFWHGLFGFTVDVFQRRQTGLLAAPTAVYPSLLGASLSQVNINSNQTNGVDIDFSHRNIIGKVGYSITGNASITRTKNLYQVRGSSGNSYDNWLNNNNNRYNDLYKGYGSAGRFTSFNDIYNSTINYGGGNRAAVPGDYKYVDWNGDGTINLNATPGQSDQYIIGTNGTVLGPTGNTTSTPLVSFGLTVALQYANFDLNALFQGTAGKLLAYNDASLNPLQFSDNAFSFFMDRWHPADPTANQFDPNTVYVPGYYALTGTTPDPNSQFNVQNASYVRLKSLELGYSFPVKWARVVGIKKARIYANGYNIFTLTKLRNYDPEHPATDRSNDYPLNKTYNLGVSVTF